MLKETVRPILLAEVERCREAEATLQPPEPIRTWVDVEGLMRLRQEARLKRLQAELQLWLADQVWERQEKEEWAAWNKEERPTEAPPPASPTGKT